MKQIRMFAVALACLSWAQLANAQAAAPAPAKKTCKVSQAPPSAADKALSREEYDTALDLFQKMEPADPDASRLGVIHVLIEQNKVKEAQEKAAAWTAAEPNSLAAKEATGEVLFRRGELLDALSTEAKVVAADVCVARAHLVAASVQHLAGNHATEKREIELAHKLAPQDIDIRRAWIGTLPRKRQVEEDELLVKDSLLNEKDQSRLENSLTHTQDFRSSDCQPSEPVEHAKFPIQSILNGPTNPQGYALDVLFNGKRRRLEIDTGASGILLSREATNGLALTRRPDELKLQTGGVGDQGNVASAITFVESIRIGNVEFHNCPIELLSKRGRLDVDGLIGADFFAKYLVSMDFRSLQMSLDPLPKRPDDPAKEETAKDDETVAPVVRDRYIAPEMKDWTKVWRNGHELVIPVGIGRAVGKLFLIDTGAGLMSISPEAAREVTKVNRADDLGVHGISGEVKQVFETNQFKLVFAGLGLDVSHMTAFDTTSISHNAGFEISGFLGAPVLYRLAMHIDYRDNLIKFDYDPKNDPAMQLGRRY
jgi:predicted aspartyl protease